MTPKNLSKTISSFLLEHSRWAAGEIEKAPPPLYILGSPGVG